MFAGVERVLVLAPHLDDEVIGCGGSLLMHREAQRTITILYFTDGSSLEKDSMRKNQRMNTRKQEALHACAILHANPIFLDFPERSLEYSLSTVQKVMEIIQQVQPDLVYLPHRAEKDREHRIVHEIGKEAVWMAYAMMDAESAPQPIRACRRILEYEVWTPFSEVTYLQPIDSYVEEKIALVKMYASQVAITDYAQGIVGLNTYRGILHQGHCRFAEAFQVKLICE